MKSINMGQKFGKFLIDRDSGRDVYEILKREIKELKGDEKLFLDFSGVVILNPSFCDEVFGQIEQDFPEKMIVDKNANHALMVAFETVEETRGIKFNFGEKIGVKI